MGSFQTEKKQYAKIEKLVKEIESLEDPMRMLSDRALQTKTIEFKSRYANGESLEDLLCEAYAVCREACYRVRNEFPYHAQLLGATILHFGDIAEMKTGEGKTLTSVLPIYLNALTGKGVHVVTVNEYLSQRDAIQNAEILRWLGITVGLNKQGYDQDMKRKAYECDVTYTTNSELGFDYLRDHMVQNEEDKVMRGLHVVLLDEIDSILIDEAKTPLVISNTTVTNTRLIQFADELAKYLKRDEHYTLNQREQSVVLTEEGIKVCERAFQCETLYDLDHVEIVHRINQAMRANYLMHKEKDYLVKEDEILIVDANTGRVMEGRQWSDGLHQAICAKERIAIKEESETVATITYQNFFRLYDKISGMTGTAKTSEEEFREVYNMYVFTVPTNKPIQRIDAQDELFGTKRAKYAALVKDVISRHKTGQPILIGTKDIDTSELLSKILTNNGISHTVLNAKNDGEEAEIIKRAGQLYAVTIATNMAGRGTDIKLGKGVQEVGGFCVLGSERHESKRIDDQLRGRSGRQGDVGFSKFYLSLEDALIKRYGSESLEAVFASLGDEKVTSKLLTNAIEQAQKRVEGLNFDARKYLLEYDDILRIQRETIYAQRDHILKETELTSFIQSMMHRTVEDLVSYAYECEDVYRSICDTLQEYRIELEEELYQVWISGGKKRLVDRLSLYVWHVYETRVEHVKEYLYAFEKPMMLDVLDRLWIEQMNRMLHLKTNVQLNSYANKNPLQVYSELAYTSFDALQTRLAKEVTKKCLTLKIAYYE